MEVRPSEKTEIHNQSKRSNPIYFYSTDEISKQKQKWQTKSLMGSMVTLEKLIQGITGSMLDDKT